MNDEHIVVDAPDYAYREKDSALAKLWAGDGARRESNKQLETSPYFGIVDDYYSLLALPRDVISPHEMPSVQEGKMPFLTEGEIFPATAEDSLPAARNGKNDLSTALFAAGDSSGVKRAVHGFLKVERLDGGLRIAWPRAARKMELAVCDPAGRVMRRWPAKAGAEAFLTWDLTDGAGRRLVPGVYLLILRIDGVLMTKRIHIPA